MTEESSNIEELPILTFNSLYNLLREEKKNKTLVKLPEKFYEAFENFIENKKKDIGDLKKGSTDDDKLTRELNALKNSKKVFLELINIRACKISNIGVKNGLFKDEALSKEQILEREMKFYESVETAVGKLKHKIV